jgi:F-type H+-transporting ATPase subunit delta
MNNPRIAGRYAKSLIDLAEELDQVDVICTDMRFVQSICKSNPDFVAVLRSPIIKPGTKEKIIKAITESSVNVTTISFIRLLIQKGRENNLPEIASAYIDQVNLLKGIHQLKITTAVPISEAVKDEIVAKVKSSSPYKNIEIETVIKEELIGGFLLEMEGTLVDASILRDLNDIKKNFMDNEYIHKI